MTKKQFKKILKDNNIFFEEIDNKIIINGSDVNLSSCTTLPEGILFNNGGYVDLYSCTSLPKGISFNNGGNVYLPSCTSLPEGISFNNGGNVNLSSCTSLPEGISFNNGRDVYLSSCTSLPEGISFNNGGNVDLRSCTSLPEGISFNNGGYVNLSSCTSLPEGISFNNGGDVYLSYTAQSIATPYLKRFNIPITDNTVILYKKVSKDFKTREGTRNETIWLPGTVVEHNNWNPTKEECGEGKFHACARPHWCDMFRNNIGDKYIAIQVNVDDLYEWKNQPSYPGKIGFRKGYVIGEVERIIKN